MGERSDGYGGTYPTRGEERTCVVCGEKFYTTRSGMYCSKKCQRKAQNRRQYVVDKAKGRYEQYEQEE